MTARAAFLKLILFLSLASALSLGPPQTLADAEPKEDAHAILSKAADLVDLQAPGRAPFLMLAKVTLSEDTKSVEGVYAIASAGPGQFRRVFRFPNFTSTEIVTEGIIYRQRSTEAVPFLIWEAEELLSPASRYRPEKVKIRRVQREHTGTADLTCIIAQADLAESRICVDTASGAPFSVDRGTDLSGLESMREHFEFADYQPFEGRMYPRKLTFRGWGSRLVEVQIQKLLRPESLPPDEFTPPKGAVRFHYCDSPETSGELRPSARGTVPIGFRNIQIAMYFQVSPVGAVQYAQVVYSSDPLHNKEILNWFVGTHFPVRTCAGTPVSYETVITLATGN